MENLWEGLKKAKIGINQLNSTESPFKRATPLSTFYPFSGQSHVSPKNVVFKN